MSFVMILTLNTDTDTDTEAFKSYEQCLTAVIVASPPGEMALLPNLYYVHFYDLYVPYNPVKRTK